MISSIASRKCYLWTSKYEIMVSHNLRNATAGWKSLKRGVVSRLLVIFRSIEGKRLIDRVLAEYVARYIAGFFQKGWWSPLRGGACICSFSGTGGLEFAGHDDPRRMHGPVKGQELGVYYLLFLNWEKRFSATVDNSSYFGSRNRAKTNGDALNHMIRSSE
jgi:hypothetical protein